MECRPGNRSVAEIAGMLFDPVVRVEGNGIVDAEETNSRPIASVHDTGTVRPQAARVEEWPSLTYWERFSSWVHER